jgi:hypothetical protein
MERQQLLSGVVCIYGGLLTLASTVGLAFLPFIEVIVQISMSILLVAGLPSARSDREKAESFLLLLQLFLGIEMLLGVLLIGIAMAQRNFRARRALAICYVASSSAYVAAFALSFHPIGPPIMIVILAVHLFPGILIGLIVGKSKVNAVIIT